MPCVTRLQVLRGTSAERISFLPLIGELVFDTDLSMMFVGDGLTYGGNPFSGTVPITTIIYTADATLSGVDYAIADSASPIEFQLPDATTYTKKINIKNFNSGLLTVTPFGAQLIDGETEITLDSPSSFELIPKNGAWYIW